MSSKTGLQDENEIARATQDILKSVNPGPFTPSAFSTLKSRVLDYLSDVIRESARIARHHDADVISPKHVETACDRLTMSPQTRLARHCGTIAGLLLGAFASTLSSMVVAAQWPTSGIVTAICTGLPGAFLLGVHLRRE